MHAASYKLRPRDSRSPRIKRAEGRCGCSTQRYRAFPSASLQRSRVTSFTNHPAQAEVALESSCSSTSYFRRDKGSLKAPGSNTRTRWPARPNTGLPPPGIAEPLPPGASPPPATREREESPCRGRAGRVAPLPYLSHHM